MTETLTQPSDPAPVRDQPARSRDAALVLGVPAAWAVTLLFHPTGEQWYPTVHNHLATWQAVHLAMIAFIPLMALAIYRLIDGIDNTPARASRLALPVFVVCYGAFEAILGVGIGLLVSGVDDLPPSEQATGATLVDAYTDSPTLATIELLAGLSCGIAIIAAAFALRRATMVSSPMVAALVVSAPLIAIHAPPFGPLGLALFMVAATAALRHPPTPAEPVVASSATSPDA